MQEAPSNPPLSARQKSFLLQRSSYARYAPRNAHGSCLRQTDRMDTIRTYRPDDFSACLALFNDNVPTFFSAGERADFVRFLTHHAATWHYQGH